MRHVGQRRMVALLKGSSPARIIAAGERAHDRVRPQHVSLILPSSGEREEHYFSASAGIA